MLPECETQIQSVTHVAGRVIVVFLNSDDNRHVIVPTANHSGLAVISMI